MLSKEEVADKFFNNEVDLKDLHPFKQETPKGNIVFGYICKQVGDFLSSMVLLDVEIPSENRHITKERFLRGMPKQHYYDKNDWNLLEDKEFTSYYFYEKLDGTCLMLYTIYDEDDKLIEIVPRTRGMPVAPEHILRMFNLIDKAQINKFYSVPHHLDCVLIFELFGILNCHEILYYKTYIDIAFIGATIDKEVLPLKDALRICYDADLQTPQILFDVCSSHGVWRIWPRKSTLIPFYYDDMSGEKYNSLEECIERVADVLEEVNQNYKNENGYFVTEGCVINGFNEKGGQRYVKVKPKSIWERAILGSGIPPHVIRKEVYKYFDEYGVIEVKKIYDENKFHYMDFVIENLLEEFPEDIVNKHETKRRITETFHFIWELKTPSLSIQNVINDLLDKYPDKPVKEVMRLFAKEYPQFKNKSGEVYSILRHLLKGDEKNGA